MVIIDVDMRLSILTSSFVALVYTMFGQMISVAYTDVIQLIMLVAGLVREWSFNSMERGGIRKLSSQLHKKSPLSYTRKQFNYLLHKKENVTSSGFYLLIMNTNLS